MTAPARHRPGEFAVVIREALAAGRVLTADEKALVTGLHPYGEPGRACPACRYPWRTGRRSCPSRLFAEGGIRAAFVALPVATAQKRCRVPGCSATLSVPAGSADGGMCDSCSAQSSGPDLFGGL